MNLQLPGDWRDKVLDTLSKDEPQYAGLKQEHQSLQGRLERLKQLFLLGDISEQEYRKLRDELQGQINAIPLPAQGKMIDLERAAQLVGNVEHFGKLPLWKNAKCGLSSCTTKYTCAKGL